MYLHDELIILGLVFVDIVIIFYIYRFLKNKYRSQINNIQEQLTNSSHKKATDEIAPQYADDKKSFISEQIKKMEALQKELQREKKRVQEVKGIAQEAFETKSKFLKNVTTDLQAPIYDILDESEILQKEFGANKHLQHISNSANHLHKMVLNIIRTTSTQNNHISIDETAVNLKQLLKNIIRKEEENAAQKGLELILDIDENVPLMVMLDVQKVQEIVENLVNNAVKFTYEGYVKVLVHAKAASLLKNSVDLEISVEDSGRGVDVLEQKKIFDAFSNDSLSVGLSINKKMAQLMSGDITMKNNGMKGSIFKFSLPNVEVVLQDDPAANEDDVDVDFSLVGAKESRVMLIDAQSSTRDAICKNFKDSPIEVEEFTSAKEAISALKEREFSMILIDIDILCSEEGAVAKVISGITTTPIVTLVDTRVKDKAIEALDTTINIAGHLKKPISKAELFKVSLQVLNFR